MQILFQNISFHLYDQQRTYIINPQLRTLFTQKTEVYGTKSDSENKINMNFTKMNNNILFTFNTIVLYSAITQYR